MVEAPVQLDGEATGPRYAEVLIGICRVLESAVSGDLLTAQPADYQNTINTALNSLEILLEKMVQVQTLRKNGTDEVAAALLIGELESEVEHPPTGIGFLLHLIDAIKELAGRKPQLGHYYGEKLSGVLVQAMLLFPNDRGLAESVKLLNWHEGNLASTFYCETANGIFEAQLKPLLVWDNIGVFGERVRSASARMKREFQQCLKLLTNPEKRFVIHLEMSDKYAKIADAFSVRFPHEALEFQERALVEFRQALLALPAGTTPSPDPREDLMLRLRGIIDSMISQQRKGKASCAETYGWIKKLTRELAGVGERCRDDAMLRPAVFDEKAQTRLLLYGAQASYQLRQFDEWTCYFNRAKSLDSSLSLSFFDRLKELRCN